jgi:Flp pilus assembly protein TadG
MQTRLRDRSTRRRGAAAVEFACIIPLVIMLIFGMIEFGRGYMVQHIITETARRACRYAVSLNSGQVPGTSSSGSSYSGNWNQYVTDKIITPTLTYNGITGATPTYLVNEQSVDVSTAQSPQYSGTVYGPGDEVTVKISVPYNAVAWGIGQTTYGNTNASTGYLVGGTLAGQYTLRKE